MILLASIQFLQLLDRLAEIQFPIVKGATQDDAFDPRRPPVPELPDIIEPGSAATRDHADPRLTSKVFRLADIDPAQHSVARHIRVDDTRDAPRAHLYRQIKRRERCLLDPASGRN